MTVVQVLTVNVLTDGLPAVALSRDPASPETMAPRHRPQGQIFSRGVWAALGGAGVVIGLSALAAYLIGRALGGGVAQTMAFATVALAELAFVYSCRSIREAAWSGPRNWYLASGVALSAALVALVLYVPALRAPFGTVPLSPVELGVVVGLALVPFLVVEAAKVPLRRRPAA
jgi:Ca2+-transporting ATPase